MLGLIQGVNTAVGREVDRRDQTHAQNINLRSQFLDRHLNQARFNANYNLQKTDLESTLESRSVQRAATRQQMQQSADRHPLEMEGLGLRNQLSSQTLAFNEKANPKRLEAMDWANKIQGQAYGFNEKANPLRLEGLRLGNENTQSIITSRTDMNRRAETEHGWAGEKHQDWRDNAPLREQTRENAMKLGEWQGGEGFELLQKGARVDLLQKEADLGLTKARTQGLTTGRSGSGSSVKTPMTYEQTKDLGKVDPFVESFKKVRRFWFDGYYPYDAPEGKTSQKTLLRDWGQNYARQFRQQLPISEMNIGDLRSRASAVWQGMLEGEGGPEFLKGLQNNVPLEERASRIENARNYFVDSVMNEIFNPTPALTVDQMPGALDDIDPALLGQGAGWGILKGLGPDKPIPDNAIMYKGSGYEIVGQDETGYQGRPINHKGLLPAPTVHIPFDEATSPLMDRSLRADLPENPLTQGLSPAETQPSNDITLPANAQDRAVQSWLQTGEMDWMWFLDLPDEAKIRMYNQLPDYKRDEFIGEHDKAIMALPMLPR